MLYKLIGLASDNVPLLRSCNNYVSLGQLFLAELHIACELSYLNAKIPKALAELSNNLGSQGLHWRNIDNLESYV